MTKLAIDEGVEHRPEQQQANADTPEETILLPEREPNSVAHIASPHLADPDQAKDFEKQVFTE
jgi:hypothetical protein